MGIWRLDSKRTFVAGGLTGTAVWAPRSFERGEREGEGGGLCLQLCMMHDPGKVPRSVHLLIFCTLKCATVGLLNVIFNKCKLYERSHQPLIENQLHKDHRNPMSPPSH